MNMKNISEVVQKTDTETLYQRAMAQVKASAEKMLVPAHDEAVKNRLAAGMDENANRLHTDEDGQPKKRGRKPKIKSEETPQVLEKKPKKEKVVKAPKKKEKRGMKGRVAALPVLRFSDESEDGKFASFDKAMIDLIGKYDGKTLIFKGEKINLTREITKPTKKNPKGVLHVIATKNGSSKILSSYEWEGRFYPARVLNYAESVKTK